MGFLCKEPSLEKSEDMEPNGNPLICDPEEGVCGIPDVNAQSKVDAHPTKKPVTAVYYTDPICSSCWGIEPQLRRLKLEYGDSLSFEYRMGGLLPDWSYNSGGISKPSDVAHHWDEVSLHYDMPIDGDVWLEDPLPSSYPPSIAFKAAQMQDPEKAIVFLRLIRESLFLRKRNITRWEHMEEAAKSAGLDLPRFRADFEGGAKERFEEDLKSARQSGVRGFPTILFTDAAGRTEIVYGAKPYASFEAAVLKLHPTATKHDYDRGWEALFSKYRSLTAREFAELSGIPRSESESRLDALCDQGVLSKLTNKNGSLWFLR